MILVLLSVAGLGSYGIGNSITAPLEKLTKVARQVAAGDLNATAEVNTADEIGILGNTLNNMSVTAKKLVANLEEMVVERTHAIERRFAQIQAVAEVGKAVAAQHDLEDLLTLTTHLISSRFGFYHIGIFLLDQRDEYAILRASNSSGGKKMLDREHKLRVGTEGIVGTVAGSGEARIALDVGEDAVYFDNPDLPQTRSEMALPMIAGGEVQGVLDVQSLEANAFSAEDIPALQILADQLAIAVQNARMLRDTQEALFAARKATGEVSQKGWQATLKNTGAIGYIGLTHGEVVQATKEIDEYTKQVMSVGDHLLSDDQLTINVPVIARGQTIGMLRLTKPPHAEPWSLDEISDVESLSNQLSNTLDSARLYSEAQQRAAREQMIGEITATITAATEVDDIIRETVTQLGKTFQDADVTLRLKTI
jgi:GAF domain-containing protein/HAMP domain-containing protein